MIFNLFPNPTTQGDEVNLIVENLLENTSYLDLEIIDITGKQILQKRFIPESTKLDTPIQIPNQLESGMYLVSVRTDHSDAIQQLIIGE
jgi:hypothetical protein